MERDAKKGGAGVANWSASPRLPLTQQAGASTLHVPAALRVQHAQQAQRAHRAGR